MFLLLVNIVSSQFITKRQEKVNVALNLNNAGNFPEKMFSFCAFYQKVFSRPFLIEPVPEKVNGISLIDLDSLAFSSWDLVRLRIHVHNQRGR